MSISKFHAENGPFHSTNRNNAGVARAYRALKRAQAEERNGRTPSSRRKAVRMGTVNRLSTKAYRRVRRGKRSNRSGGN